MVLLFQIMLPKGGNVMEVQYQEIQELLRRRADLNVRLNLMPYDGTVSYTHLDVYKRQM